MSQTTQNAPAQTGGGVSAMPTRRQFGPLAKVATVQDAFDHPEFLRRIGQSLPKHMTAERMLRVCTQAVLRTPKLAQCSPLSLIGAFLTCSQVGLEPNTPLQHVHLIPFEVNKWNAQTRQREHIRTDVQLIFGYPGLLDLSYRSGLVTNVGAHVVWKDDEFSFSYGTNAHVDHRPLGKPRGDKEMPQWAYAHANLRDGQAFEVMPYSEILMIRNRTQAYQSAIKALEDATAKNWKTPASYTEAPWIKYEYAMARKTAFRQLSKWLPRSVELAGALALDEQQDRGTVNFADVVLEHGSVLDGGLALTDDSQDEGAHDPTFGLREKIMDGDQREKVPAAGDSKPQAQTRAPAKARQTAPAEPRQEQRQAAPTEPPAGHPAAAEDGPEPGRFGDEPPFAGDAPAQPVQQAQPAADAVDYFLIDEHGELVEGDEGQTDDPVVFVERFLARWRKSSNQPTMFENNMDAIDDARKASPVAAALLDKWQEDRVVPDAPAGGTTQTPDRWRVETPLNAQGRPYIPGFISNAKISLGSVTTAERFDEWIAANAEQMSKLPPVARTTVQTAINDRRSALGLSTVSDEPVAQAAASRGDDAAAEDKDAAWADEVIRDTINTAKTKRGLEVATGNGALQVRIKRYEQDRPELYKKIGDAYRAKVAAFGPAEGGAP